MKIRYIISLLTICCFGIAKAQVVMEALEFGKKTFVCDKDHINQVWGIRNGYYKRIYCEYEAALGRYRVGMDDEDRNWDKGAPWYTWIDSTNPIYIEDGDRIEWKEDRNRWGNLQCTKYSDTGERYINHLIDNRRHLVCTEFQVKGTATADDFELRDPEKCSHPTDGSTPGGANNPACEKVLISKPSQYKGVTIYFW